MSQETKKLELQIRQAESTYCDYCNLHDVKLVNRVNDDRDICFDCILEIYNFAKKEIL